MKKFAAFIIIAMMLSMSTAVLTNILSSESLPSGENFIDRIENSLSENVPFREKLSGLMDTVRYSSGVRHFDNIYIGNDGSLLLDIEKPTSRTFSAAKKRRFPDAFVQMITQMSPEQPSLMIRSMVSCSLSRASCGIRYSLLCSPSFTRP